MTWTTLARRVLLYCDVQCIRKMNSLNTITERRFCWLRCVDLFERQNFSSLFFSMTENPTVWFCCTIAFIQTPCTLEVNNRTSFILESVTTTIILTGIDTKSHWCIKYYTRRSKMRENKYFFPLHSCYAQV